MKQIQTDKYSIAWFKLAECVSRKEKERALGVYRLLAHSFDNAAVVHQLEGDIMLAFNEQDMAVAKYKQAAACYEKQGELIQAIAVYEHIMSLTYSLDVLKKMIGMYAQLQDYAQMLVYIKRASCSFLKRGSLVQLLVLLEQCHLTDKQKAYLFIEFALIIGDDQLVDPQVRLQFIDETIRCIGDDEQLLQLFLTKLRHTHQTSYEYACNYIQNKS